MTTAEGIRKTALRPGQREPMGQRVARLASPGTEPGPPLYRSLDRPGRRPNHPKKTKRAISITNPHMAEIVIATRQAVSLNGFSAE